MYDKVHMSCSHRCNEGYLQELGAGGAGEGGSVLVAPLSVQPTRKAAGAAGALRRLWRRTSRRAWHLTT